jgi:NAD(P)H-dependent FMN reductase
MAASYRENGNNQCLANLASNIAQQAGAEITALRYTQLCSPLFRESDEVVEIPDQIKNLEAHLNQSDGMILAMPEHNWSFPASLKNIIDWLSVCESKPLQGKTALLMCATPSKRGGVVGLQQLRVPLGVLGVWVHPQMIAIGNVFESLKNGMLQDSAEQAFFNESVRDFVHITGQIKGDSA